MKPFTLSLYARQDLGPVVNLLQACLPLEPITLESFARRVLLDVNFDAQGALTAKDSAGELIGFLLAITRKRSLEEAPPDTDRGWITLFAVAPAAREMGVGSRLLQQAEDWLRSQGRGAVLISSYAPGYWTPGVDEAAYPTALDWLCKRGYETVMRPLSMQIEIEADWKIPQTVKVRRVEQAKQGLHILPFTIDWIPSLNEFLKREFPGDWQRHVRETMSDILRGYRPSDELWLAVREWETIAGFAQSEQERFGPIGVAESERGRGIGALLMYRVLEAMQARGLRRAWFLWTNDATADRFYRPAGFQDARRFALLKKTL